jgi:hypothetical protein
MHGLPSGSGDAQPIEARREALMRLVAGVDRIVFSEALAAKGAVVLIKHEFPTGP